jgi:hypothetical protein
VMISEATPSGMTCGDDFPSGTGFNGRDRAFMR